MNKTVKLIMKLVWLAFLLAAIAAGLVWSLRMKVEEELGPGTWEMWLAAVPPVEVPTEYRGDGPPEGSKNLEARFWTGRPRVEEGPVESRDYFAFSKEYLLFPPRPAWFAIFLPNTTGKEPVSFDRVLKKWASDPTSENSKGSTGETPLPSGHTWASFVPHEVTSKIYGWGYDSLFTSTRFAAPLKFVDQTWPEFWIFAESMARLHNGTVVFVIPRYENSREVTVTGVNIVLIASTTAGPSVATFMIPVADENFDPSKHLVSVTSVEEGSGVNLFQDLPREWREYLRSPDRPPLPWSL